jgi:glycosyltransferase involved in cell wall biosynthesis
VGSKVAIIQDWLVSMRGGERVLESLCRIYPDADLFTLRYDPDGVSPEISSHKVRASFIDPIARRLPLGRAGFRMLLPLFPLAIESFRLNEYDLVISSSHAVAKGVIPGPSSLHISYIHSPMRYVWEAEGAYGSHVPGGAVGRAAFALLAHYIRLWDTASTARIDTLIANSRYTQERIRRCYGRESQVISPPVNADRFARIPDPAPFAVGDDPVYLCVSALVPYKRVELAVRAFIGRKARLVVVGEGPEGARLRALAAGSPNIQLRGRVDDAELDRLYAECRAVIHPALDDFGIVPVEALAAGRPVVAFAGGGATDSVREGETGVLFAEATPDALADAVTRLEQLRPRLEPGRLRAEARRFDRLEFERRFRAAVDSAQRRSRSGGAAPP